MPDYPKTLFVEEKYGVYQGSTSAESLYKNSEVAEVKVLGEYRLVKKLQVEAVVSVKVISSYDA